MPHLRYHILIELRFMADEQDTSLVFLQRPLQLVFGVHIQVIGGLVQQQEVGFPVDELAQPDLGLLAAA